MSDTLTVSEIGPEHHGLRAYVKASGAPKNQRPTWCEILGVRSEPEPYRWGSEPSRRWYITARHEDGSEFETGFYNTTNTVSVQP